MTNLDVQNGKTNLLNGNGKLLQSSNRITDYNSCEPWPSSTFIQDHTMVSSWRRKRACRSTQGHLINPMTNLDVQNGKTNLLNGNGKLLQSSNRITDYNSCEPWPSSTFIQDNTMVSSSRLCPTFALALLPLSDVWTPPPPPLRAHMACLVS